MPQDAVFVEARHPLQGGLQRCRHFGLARPPRRFIERRRKACVEQCDNAGGDARMLAQRRPHVTLRIGHADLAQEARDGAQQRHVAPGEPGREHEPVVAVVLGGAAHDGKKTGLERFLAVGKLDRLTRGAFEHHVVEPDLRGVARLDVIGALVDHAEAHVFQDRHARRERDRFFAGEDLEPGGGLRLAGIAIELDAERALPRQALDDAHVGNRAGRRIDFAVVDRERVAVAGGQRVAAFAVVRGSDRRLEPVPPAAHDPFNRALEALAIRIGGLAGVALDDEMHAHQRAFGEERVEGAHAALIGHGQIVADLSPDAAVIALARDIDEHRHEAVEAVAPRQHAHARPLVELQDRERNLIKRLVVDLEQLVARIGLQHVDQRLAGMALRVEAGAADDVIDLAPQIGNGAGRAGVGGRGEQTAKSVLADQLAGGVEALDADIVELHAAVHTRAHRRLGDDQHPGLLQKFADFRSEGDELIAATQQPHLGRAQQSEPGFKDRLQRAGGVGVVARAQEGEIVAGQPFEKQDGLGNVLDRQRRRILPQVGDGRARPRQHRRPVLHADADLGENLFEAAEDLPPHRRVLQAVDVDADEAFAPDEPAFFKAGQPPRRVALDRKHRMHQKSNVEAALVELPEHRIDEKRHVVIEDAEHPDAGRGRCRREPQLGRALCALRQKAPRVCGEAGELLGAVALEVLGNRQREKLCEKIRRDRRLPRRQRRGGRADQRLAGTSPIVLRNSLDVHASPFGAVRVAARTCGIAAL